MTALGYIGSLAYGLVCLLISLIAYKLGLPKKYTRKIVHILVGTEWFILYHTLGAGIHFVAVCVIFTLLLAVTYKKSLMPMISSDSDNAPGTVYYGISMTLMAIASCFLEGFVFAFGIAVFCTSVGDGLAGVIGAAFAKFNIKIYKSKTLLGTLSAFVFSLICTLLFAFIYKLNLSFADAVLISLLAAGLELITEFGLDNITLPLGVSAFSYFLMYFASADDYAVAIALTPFIIAMALGREILTKKGVLIALFLDILVTVSLGNFGFVLLLSFLLLSVTTDKIKKKIKNGKDEITKRGDKRDEIQVLANGIIPAVMALCYLITHNFVFILGYNVALAESFADTCASAFGVFSKTVIDPFKMKKVPKGLSGGMSIYGTLASIAAPFLLLLIPMAFGIIDFSLWAFCSAFAVFGAILDSLLGSLLQCKFICKGCGIITEKNIHCGERTHLISGFKFINNDAVNLISSAASAILAIIVFLI